jgi:hypothetical protein
MAISGLLELGLLEQINSILIQEEAHWTPQVHLQLYRSAIFEKLLELKNANFTKVAPKK